MKQKIREHLVIANLIIVLLLITSISCVIFSIEQEVSGSQTTGILYVGPDQTYQNIQDAIDAAQTDETIKVYPGTYFENLIIRKRIILLGLSKEKTIINGSGSSYVIKIKYENVYLSSFTLSGSALYLEGANNSTITGLICNHNFGGIRLINTNYSKISNCEILGGGISFNNGSFNNEISKCDITNSHYGVYIAKDSSSNIINSNEIYDTDQAIRFASDNNEIRDNEIWKNYRGIYIDGCDNNKIIGNDIYDQEFTGIQFYPFSKNNIILKNYLENNKWGAIWVYSGTTFTEIIDNYFKSNSIGIFSSASPSGSPDFTKIDNNYFYDNYDAMTFDESNDNYIINNSIEKNYNGVLINNSVFNCFENNTISNSSNVGIKLNSKCVDNSIYYNNFLFNKNQIIDSGRNHWNSVSDEGNYWSDYSGLDNGDNARTADDGFGDTDIPHAGVDLYPYMEMFGWLNESVQGIKKENWIINDYQVLANQSKILAGNLIVEDGGSLTLKNVNMQFHCLKSGEFELNVREGGKLEIYQSEISTKIKNYDFKFIIHGKMILKDTYISCLWGNSEYEGGIQVYSNDVLIEDNLIKHSSQSGISVMQSSPTIRGNTIHSNKFYGIDCREYGSPIIINNTISSNGMGIRCTFHSSPIIENNLISNNENYGVFICGDSCYPTLENNEIKSNKVGLTIVSKLTFTNNKIIKNSGYDIHIQDPPNESWFGDSVSINNSFEDYKITLTNEVSKLILQNHLNVYTYDANGVPIPDVDVIVSSDQDDPITKKTDQFGKAESIPVTYKIYSNKDSIIFENEVEVKSGGFTFKINPREVDLFVPRTEIFYANEENTGYKPPKKPMVDDDKDQMCDTWEEEHGLDPLDPSDAESDLDDDGLKNREEYIYQTVPVNVDTDNDGLNDGAEIKVYKTNATLSDTDNDGYSDGEEIEKNTDPLDKEDSPGNKGSTVDGDNNYLIFYVLVAIIIIVFLVIAILNRIRRTEPEKKEKGEQYGTNYVSQDYPQHVNFQNRPTQIRAGPQGLPTQVENQYSCPGCGQPMIFVQIHNRYFCYYCNSYR